MPTPLEWVEELEKRLDARRPNIARFNAYYEGEHPLQFATEKFRKAFGGLFDEFADNWCAPVAQAPAERLAVVGFRFGDTPKADEDAWKFWQANHMDAEHKLAITAALVESESALLVWPDPKNEEIPKVTVEAADQMIVVCEPGSRYDRSAALKVWTDEWTGDRLATLYLPDFLFKYRKVAKEASNERIVGPAEKWVPRRVSSEEWPLPNPFGVVPVVPLRNDPRLRRPPRSELVSVIPLQDAVNKLVTDMIVASEFSAFRQKWATNIEKPIDPVTNQPVENWQLGISSLLTTPPAEIGEQSTQFGTFDATELSNFVTAVDMLVMHIASHTRTPPHYLNASADRLSGESIKAAETGLVAKVREKQLHFGEAFEEALRLCFLLLDDARAEFIGAETIWSDPESRTEAEHVDAVGKKVQMLQVPIEQAWEDAGYTPQQIRRMRALRTADELFGPPPRPGVPSGGQMPSAMPEPDQSSPNA